MPKLSRGLTPLAAVCLLFGGCATTPAGPSVAVMPAPYKSLAAFTDDETVCKHYAASQVDDEATHQNWMQTAIAGGGTLLGAGLGAAIGGGGKGAAIGAGAGALGGTAVGSLRSGGQQKSIQQRYNVAYAQCQATRGNGQPSRAANPTTADTLAWSARQP